MRLALLLNLFPFKECSHKSNRGFKISTQNKEEKLIEDVDAETDALLVEEWIDDMAQRIANDGHYRKFLDGLEKISREDVENFDWHHTL